MRRTLRPLLLLLAIGLAAGAGCASDKNGGGARDTGRETGSAARRAGAAAKEVGKEFKEAGKDIAEGFKEFGKGFKEGIKGGASSKPAKQKPAEADPLLMP